MKFSRYMKKRQKELGITNKELSEMTGISSYMISQYRNDYEPSSERMEIIKHAFGDRDTEPEKIEKPTELITVEAASKLIGMNAQALKQAIEENVFVPQIGFVINRGTENRCYIFKNRLMKYIAGEI